jgi:hypothetical protein
MFAKVRTWNTDIDLVIMLLHENEAAISFGKLQCVMT